MNMNLIKVLLIAALAVMLGACAQPPIPSDSGVSVIEYPDGTTEVNYGPGQYEDSKLQANVEGCRDWLKLEQANKFEQIDSIPASHKTFVLMHWETMAMVKEVFGKGTDPCKSGTNQWDAYIAYVEQHNETIRSVTRSTIELGKTVAVVGGVSYVAGQIVDNVGSTIEGDQINAGNNANKAGNDISQDGMVAPLTRTDTNTKNTITQTQVGSDESTIESAEISNSSPAGEGVEELEEEEGAEEPAEATGTAEAVDE